MFLLTAASYNCHNNMNLTKQLEGVVCPITVMHGRPYLAFIMGDRAGQQVALQVDLTKSKTAEYKLVPATTLKPPQLKHVFPTS